LQHLMQVSCIGRRGSLRRTLGHDPMKKRFPLRPRKMASGPSAFASRSHCLCFSMVTAMIESSLSMSYPETPPYRNSSVLRARSIFPFDASHPTTSEFSDQLATYK
jgi:hypothetical protein